MTAMTMSADRQYRQGTMLSMAAYVITLCAAVFVLNRGMVTGPWVYPLAILPGLAIIGQLLVTLRYLRDADEFIRALLAKRLIVASLAAFGLMTVWGFLETFADAPHIPGFWGYCLMWGVLGLSSLFIKDSK